MDQDVLDFVKNHKVHTFYLNEFPENLTQAKLSNVQKYI